MEENEIIEMLLQELNEQEIWFTTKNDPVISEPNEFYELDEYGDLTDKSKSKIAKEIDNYVGDGAVDLMDAIELWITEALGCNSIMYTDYLVTRFKNKPVVQDIKAYEVPLNESKRLNEQDNRNMDVINKKMEEPDFDVDSTYGKMILKTKSLLEKLSDEKMDVQVSLDNGETQTTIIVDGGKVTATMTDPEQPLKAFATGNIEINADSIYALNTIAKVLEEL